MGYDICIKHELEASCIPNSYFPKSVGKKDKPYYKNTNEHGSSCSEGYCSCAEEAPKKKKKRKRKGNKKRKKKNRKKKIETLDSFALNYIIYTGLEIEQNRLQTYLSL